jgi:hypothetical protein
MSSRSQTPTHHLSHSHTLSSSEPYPKAPSPPSQEPATPGHAAVEESTRRPGRASRTHSSRGKHAAAAVSFSSTQRQRRACGGRRQRRAEASPPVSLSSPLGSGGSCHGGAWPTVGARGSLAGGAPCIERILAPPASSVEGGRDGGAPCLCPAGCWPFHGGFWTRRREKAVQGPPDGCGVRQELLWLWRQPRLEVYSSSLSYFSPIQAAVDSV